MSNDTSTNEISSNDTQGAIIYIIGVLIWYAIGFGLILFSNIKPHIGRTKKYAHKNVYEAVNKNDILNELKDPDRRKKLWEIYFSTKSNPSITIHSITKK